MSVSASLSPPRTVPLPASRGRAFDPLKMAQWEARGARAAQLLLEIGLYATLSEGMLRRLAPDYSVIILSAKFLYFPILYLAFWPLVRRGAARSAIPACVLFWLGWGILLSLFRASLEDAGVHLLGIAINLLFVPIAWLAGGAYPTADCVAGLMRRMTIFAATVSAFALLQSRLPADHFLNVAMDFESKAFQRRGVIRATSTFQHCNVFGSFAAVAVLPAVATLQAAANGKERLIRCLMLGVIYLGGTYSGSRMAAVCGLIVLGAALFRDAKAIRSMLLGLAAAGSLIGLIFFTTPDLLLQFAPGGDARAFDTGDLIKRTIDLYYEEHFLSGWEVGGGMGLGWGPYTMGVAKYAEILKLGSADKTVHIESGYGIMVAQLGIVGLISFVVMHFWLGTVTLTRRTQFAWIGTGLTAWSLLGNIPLSLFEVSVLAVPLWLLMGVSLRQEPWQARANLLRSQLAARPSSPIRPRSAPQAPPAPAPAPAEPPRVLPFPNHC